MIMIFVMKYEKSSIYINRLSLPYELFVKCSIMFVYSSGRERGEPLQQDVHCDNPEGGVGQGEERQPVQGIE